MKFAGDKPWSSREAGALKIGALAPFTDGRRVHEIAADEAFAAASPDGTEVVVALHLLQRVRDYRAALRGWFDRVPVGGTLIVVVPHAFLRDRKIALPSPWDRDQRRLYTPGSLLQEIEEALAPNSYRVRHLADLDGGYDYCLSPEVTPDGESDIVLILERIEPPVWSVAEERVPSGIKQLATPDFDFEPKRTRIEAGVVGAPPRIVIMKLDHLGDLIMGLPALRRARRYFAESRIDLVVGSWNADMARKLGVADRVIPFDAFPRNSSEEEPNVEATLGLFRATVAERYDLAIDLRTDTDTRTLLRAVNAPVKAAIGTRAQFPFLDIALPLDSTRNEAARAREDSISHSSFSAQGSARQGHFGIRSDRERVETDCAIIWGPYLELDPGTYLFDFYLDLDEQRDDGLIKLDVALDGGRVVAQQVVSGPANFHLHFRVEQPRTRFEARIWAIDGHRSLSFTFYGGRLIRRSPENLLHQSEYSTLLVELVKLRLQEFGQLADIATA